MGGGEAALPAEEPGAAGEGGTRLCDAAFLLISITVVVLQLHVIECIVINKSDLSDISPLFLALLP